ncbi:MAG: lytic transglycosylase domain-containing protein [Acidobacteriota bacterium]
MNRLNSSRALFALSLAITAVVVPGSAQGQADPRPVLVELQLEGRWAEALEVTETLLREDTERAHSFGLDFLRGHLLTQLCQGPDAARAFVQSMARTPALEMYSRYRLALEQEKAQHPEVAAGLVATVVASGPEPLAGPATEVLHRTVLAGGDCRLLRGISRHRLPEDSQRQLAVTNGVCAERRGTLDEAREIYAAILAADRQDDPARQAAERWYRILVGSPEPAAARALGRTFHHHRQFDRAIELLEPQVRSYRGELDGEEFDVAYELVRSYFWQERFAAAAAGFGTLADRVSLPTRKAQALYQQGRSLELNGEWALAAQTFRRAYLADPTGRWSSSGLIGAMRLEWRGGDEDAALELLDLLNSRRQWTRVGARAALFAAVSDLVRGRADRAGRWLDLADKDAARNALETNYWRGRLAELQESPDEAVRRYLAVQRMNLHHPLGQDARRRLRLTHLEGPARAEGLRQAAAGELYPAWLLLEDDHPQKARAAGRLTERFARDRLAGPIVAAAERPVRNWPLWTAVTRTAEDKLLALGIWWEGLPSIQRNFPTSSPDLTFTGGLLQNRAGRTDRAIARADLLVRRTADRVPDPFLPERLRRLLYPFPHSDLLAAQGRRFGVDPYLLAAVIREESRFDPRALSSASARGLTQFVAPTARRIGAEIGLGEVTADDLYRPEVSVPLGAAYLRGLLDRARGMPHVAVASYNAGEPQARLWRSYCYSGEAAEYYSKVTFTETRGYLRKVLTSWSQYRDIYRADLAERSGR